MKKVRLSWSAAKKSRLLNAANRLQQWSQETRKKEGECEQPLTVQWTSPRYFLVCVAVFLSISPSTMAQQGSALSAIWVNTGEDKVRQEETRASSGATVTNSAWDGTTIHLFAAKNETTNFNLVLEAANTPASMIAISFNTLTGPSATISSPATADATKIFEWQDRNIELFYVRYLQINGITKVWNSIDERQLPPSMQLPNVAGVANPGTTWASRPGANQHYPDIAVPMELQPTFSIAAGQSQCIWVDIYIPQTTPAGTYLGTVTITESGVETHTVPVSLVVNDFALPDRPATKNMLVVDGLLQARTMGASTNAALWNQIETAAYMIAHRAGIDVQANTPAYTGASPDPWADQPDTFSASAITGSLYSTANGYGGRGVNTGASVYSIWTYGNFSSGGIFGSTQGAFQAHVQAWDNWFVSNAPSVERFLYMLDENNCGGSLTTVAACDAAVNTYAGYIDQLNLNTKSFVTNDLVDAATYEPNINVVASTSIAVPGDNPVALNSSTVDAEAVATIKSSPGREIWWYNGNRPYQGYPGEISDDGLSVRSIQWSVWKKQLGGYFFWDSDYWYQYGSATQTAIDVFNNPVTFDFTYNPAADQQYGLTNDSLSNGNGSLFYPGTDNVFPQSSYNQPGVFSSLRLKYWRRGIQDYDYIALANAINPVATALIVSNILPQTLWDFQTDLGGWGYTSAAVVWPNSADTWEAARAQLTSIIVGQATSAQAALSPSSLTFGSQPLGTTSSPQTLTLSNPGTSSLTIGSLQSSGTFAQANTCGSSLAVGASCTITVTFTPTAVGSQTGSLVVATNAVSSPTDMLSGTGVGTPQAVLSPSSLTFGSQPLGTTSSPQTLTLSNPGTSSLTIGSLQSSGTFAQANTCGSSLAVGASCTITVTFTPTAVGSQTGSLVVATNAVSSPTDMLSGTGVGTPQAVLSPSSLTFGSQPLGSTSSQTLTLSNPGTSSLTIGSLQSSGTFAQANTCGSSLAVGASCTITVTFAPTAVGSQTGSLVVATNAVSSPTDMLSGTGVGTPQAVLSPSSLTFGSQPLGSTSSQTLTLSNPGTSSLTIGSLQSSGTFAQANTCGSSLAVGASCTITVTFAPTAVGSQTGSLVVATNAVSSPTDMLSGTGVGTPQAVLSPSSLTFGSQPLGSTSSQTLTLSNPGTSSLTIINLRVSGNFKQTTACARSLAPGATCNITVTFAPNATGSRSGLLTVGTNANHITTATLSGTGVRTPPHFFHISLSGRNKSQPEDSWESLEQRDR